MLGPALCLAFLWSYVTAGAQAELSRPLAELPANIPVKKGAVSLHARAGHPDDEAINLYLINDTDQDAEFPLTDNDVMLKRETIVPKKGWHRTEPFTSIEVDCLSPPPTDKTYIKVLPPKHFVPLMVIFNDAGDFPKYKVRYRFFSQGWGKLSSNEVEARVDPFWFEWCVRDKLGILTAPTEVLCDVALHGMPKLPEHIKQRSRADELSLYGGWPENARMSACGSLGTRSWKDSAPTLWKIVQTDPEGSRVREVAIDVLCREGENLIQTADWLADPTRGASTFMQQDLMAAMVRPARFKPQNWTEGFRTFLEKRLSDPKHTPTEAEVTLYAVGSPMKQSVQRLRQLSSAEQDPVRRKMFEMMLNSESVRAATK
jgi:hypothetical protein